MCRSAAASGEESQKPKLRRLRMRPRDPDPPDLDPTFRSTRREAAVIFAVWVAALLWTVPFCYLAGYGDTAWTDTVAGIPRWVLWGVAAPWAAASAFALWFSLRLMGDDDLGEGNPDEDGSPEGAP
ncbi:MAG: hypothetical protein OXG13_09925 [Gemmatimonadaceae bacterium]|nr:hypothetical protein [Gemmatimonadaceae bacterium]